MKLCIKKAQKLCKKNLLSIIRALIYDEGILKRRNPKVPLTACAVCDGVSEGQKAIKFVTFILYDSSKQRVTESLSFCKIRLGFLELLVPRYTKHSGTLYGARAFVIFLCHQINIVAKAWWKTGHSGEQGWRSGRALAFQCGAGSIPGFGVISGLSLLVLYSAPRGFSPGTPVFPSPQKLTFDLIWFDCKAH